MYLRVEVTPGAKKESLEEAEGKWLISVKEEAERNQANERVRELVAAHLGKTVGDVRIISGHHSHTKMLSVRDDE